MASLNKVHLIGNAGKDAELRRTPSGAAVANVSLATSRKWKNKESGDTQEETEWHRCIFYERLAEIAGEYIKKGKPVYVEGRLKTRKWQDKEGRDVYTTEIICEQMQLLGGRDDQAEAPAPARPAATKQPQQRQAAPSTGTGFDDMDSDCPF